MEETIKRAIADSGETLYRIAKEAGVSYSVVHGFVNGSRSLTLPIAEKLCRYLGLTLTKSK